jgi:hypothetical protein
MESNIYNFFYSVCINKNCDEVEKYIIDNNIDINFDDNYYIFLLAKRNDINFLKLIKKYGGDLHCDDESLAQIFALQGQLDCLEYIIDDCENDDWKIIMETNSYTNCERTKNFINNRLLIH